MTITLHTKRRDIPNDLKNDDSRHESWYEVSVDAIVYLRGDDLHNLSSGIRRSGLMGRNVRL